MGMTAASSYEAELGWGTRSITPQQAGEFAAKVTATSKEQLIIAKNLGAYPPSIAVRGVFFEGISRLVTEARGPGAIAALRKKAGLPEQTTAFRQYPHRDFYKLYYLVAPVLHPGASFVQALRRTARTFFPIFRNSLLGRTMGAFMGDEPRTILPLLAKAYNVSVAGNEHSSELVGERRVHWRCRVEPVEWYEETFGGIVEGTAADPARAGLTVRLVSKALRESTMDYEFEITW